MRANPGGAIAPKDVVGRDPLIKRLWEILEGQSVILTAERRIGKSSVIQKMHEEGRVNTVTILHDVEGRRTPLEFVERVYHDVFSLLSKKKKTAAGAQALLKYLAGVEIAGVVKLPESVAPHWKSLLEKIIEDLMMNQEDTVVFFWDEIPLMLRDIALTCGEEVAMELLDTLRALRQTHGKKLRMVFTGSIGLHHVAAALNEAGHANPATNDMNKVEVTPLDVGDAEELAERLLEGEGLHCERRTETIAAIASLTDYIPFYIHHAVSTLKSHGDHVDPDRVAEVISQALVAEQDPWDLEHYVNRLGIYYGPDRKPVVLAVLDELAAAENILSIDALHIQLQTKRFPESSHSGKDITSGNRETLLGLLKLLRNDHYVRQHPDDGSFEFRFTLIKRWWRTSRGLA